MPLAHGATRLVILTKNHAIKIARIRPLGVAMMAVRAFLQPHRMRTAVKDSKLEALPLWRRYLWLAFYIGVGGVLANRQEVRLYRDYPELPLAPVVGSYLWGFIIVMLRGEPTTQEEALPLCNQYDHMDLDLPRHIFKFSDGLRYVDYGHPKVPEALGL